MEDAHYRMTTAHAMAMALESETRARDFYAGVAAQAEDDEVRRLAEEFASEEATHVNYVETWIARQPAEAEPLTEDDDDPHMPE
jgi:rubrerythrin